MTVKRPSRRRCGTWQGGVAHGTRLRPTQGIVIQQATARRSSSRQRRDRHLFLAAALGVTRGLIHQAFPSLGCGFIRFRRRPVLLGARSGVTHESPRSPSMNAMQAPRCATPQPNFLPVRPMLLRNTHRSAGHSSSPTEGAVPLPLRLRLARWLGAWLQDAPCRPGHIRVRIVRVVGSGWNPQFPTHRRMNVPVVSQVVCRQAIHSSILAAGSGLVQDQGRAPESSVEVT
jgi:hypothetical protein